MQPLRSLAGAVFLSWIKIVAVVYCGEKKEEGAVLIEIKRRIDNIPIFPKLVLTFLVITLPLFTLSLVLNNLGKQEVKNQISNSITLNIHYYFTLLEKELERVIRTQQEFINDDELMQLSNSLSIMSDYQRTKAINDLKLKHQIVDSHSARVKRNKR